MSGEGIIPNVPAGSSTRWIKRGTVICPVCEAEGRIHGSERVTPLVKTLWCRCSNLACGMTWRMQLSFEFVVSPSGIHRPDLNLPVSPTPARQDAGQTGPPTAAAA